MKNKDESWNVSMTNVISHVQLSVTFCLVLAWQRQQVTYEYNNEANILVSTLLKTAISGIQGPKHVSV
jgi:hypothetical protein